MLSGVRARFRIAGRLSSTSTSAVPPRATGVSIAEDVSAWTCSPASFGGADGCDCGCGILDPDCLTASWQSDPLNCGACGVTCGNDATCGCSGGTCSGGTIYFSEDFSDNSRGWTLGTEWAIEPAQAGTGQQQGFPDPAQDHSPSADNGVAGIVIGGNYSITPLHTAYYLTSPVINLSSAPGTVRFTFWRHLNADWDPFTTQTVEVFNGTSWVIVWTNAALGNVLLTDSAWTRFEFDVTAFKNANFRIRFGHATGTQSQFLAWVMSGWNVDDVSLGSGICL